MGKAEKTVVCFCQKKQLIHCLRHIFKIHLLKAEQMSVTFKLIDHSSVRTIKHYIHVVKRSVLNI